MPPCFYHFVILGVRADLSFLSLLALTDFSHLFIAEMVKICITGCLHGELDRVYADVAAAERTGKFTTDLIICCGDFQSLRNPSDLASMSVPAKYHAMGDFWR